mgnify:CR=1 FL=1
MKIGDFAKYNQISVQALRYYESIDLIHPIEIDPFTNYRYYHIKQSAVIDNIQFFQQLDFSLTEIKQIMNDTKTPTELNQVIENKKATLQAELKSIQHQLKSFRKGLSFSKRNNLTKRLSLLISLLVGSLLIQQNKIFTRWPKKNTSFLYVNSNLI